MAPATSGTSPKFPGRRDLPGSPRTPSTARRRAAGTASPPFPLRPRGRRREAASTWALAVLPLRTARGRPRVARARTTAAQPVVQGDGGATGPDGGDLEKETRGRGNARHARHARAPAFKMAGGRATPPHHPQSWGEAASPGPRVGRGARPRQPRLHSAIQKGEERLPPSGASWRRGRLAASAAPGYRHPGRRGATKLGTHKLHHPTRSRGSVVYGGTRHFPRVPAGAANRVSLDDHLREQEHSAARCRNIT